MDLSKNDIKSFSNESLVKFMEKIGHREAARIIQEKKLDGRKILELTETETLKWELTEFQRNLLWNCISAIKSNPLTNLDIGHQKHLKKILNREKTCSNSKEGRPPANLRKKYNKLEHNVSSNEVLTVHRNGNEPVNNGTPQPLPRKKKRYLKFCQTNKEESLNVPKYIPLKNENVSSNSLNSIENLDDSSSKKHISLRRFNNHEMESRGSFYYSYSSLNRGVIDSARKNYRTESDYIYGPCLEGTKDNTEVDRIKKYIKCIPGRNDNDKAELLNNVYLELKDTPHSSTQDPETNIYDEPLMLSTGTGTEISQLPEENTKKTPVHFMINLCCFSCYAGCTKN